MVAHTTPAAQLTYTVARMVENRECECCGAQDIDAKTTRQHGRGRKRALCPDCR